jgi:4-amino-4-deoxy-L-arabinose transferase-like glycosyltransferase
LDESPRQKPSIDLETAAFSVFVLLLCLFGNLGALGLVGPDEPRYAWIARAMAATGDWVTPRLYGEPWFEKPILYYWAAAIGFRLHLPAEWALRLPSAFAALAVAITIGFLAWRHYGCGSTRLASKPAFLASLLFATTVASIGFARAATPDMLFSASIGLAMACAATIFRRSGILLADVQARAAPIAVPRGSHALALALFGGFLGLGALAKGPAAVLLAGGAIALWALATGRWRAAIGLAHPYAIAAFCAVALPWYVLCALRNPNFIQVFIFEHNFARYLTPVFQHRQPFWFFGPITLVALLPWTACLWPAAQEGLRLWREKSWHDSPGFFFGCWAVFPSLFFSFSQSKLPGYILPGVPALALLCTAGLLRATSLCGPRRSIASAIGMAIAFTWLALGITVFLWMHRLPGPEHDAIGDSVFVAVIIAVIGAAGIAFLAFRRNSRFVALSFLLATLLVGVAGLSILPRIDPFISARWHGQLLRDDRHPERIFTYHLPRSWAYGLAFYLGRELPEWLEGDPNSALVLTTPAGLREIRQLHRFHGDLDETVQGIVYVPIAPAPH